MIILKIKKSGYTVTIPGVPSSRSPVEIDISKIDMRSVVMYLRNAGIIEYEIIADVEKDIRKVYTQKDFVKKKVKEKTRDGDYKKELDVRFNKLENMLHLLLTKEKGSSSSEKEQITNKLNNLEKLLHDTIVSPSSDHITTDNEPEIEELDFYVPDIDLTNMTLESKGVKVIKLDSDNLEDSANSLSNLIKKK